MTTNSLMVHIHVCYIARGINGKTNIHNFQISQIVFILFTGHQHVIQENTQTLGSADVVLWH